ncbi:hypothetical protein NKI74_34035, partial [Mesorhizobium sp. M0494]
MRTEKSRLKRSLLSLQELMRRIWHYKISDQVAEINCVLRGHYAYCGVAGNLRSLIKVYQVVERYWRRMLCSRSRDGGRLSWGAFNQIKERNPLLRPKLRLPHRERTHPVKLSITHIVGGPIAAYGSAVILSVTPNHGGVTDARQDQQQRSRLA